MRIRLLASAALISTVWALAGCGSSDSTDEGPPTMPASAPARALPVADDATEASADEVVMRTGLTVVIEPVLRGLPSSERYNLTLTSWQLGPAAARFTAPLRARGSITVPEGARESGRDFAAPFFWGIGENKSAKGPLVWLSHKAFDELKSADETTITPTSLEGGLPGGVTAGSVAMTLRKTGADTHSLTVLDRKVKVPVIVAEDESGTRYEILDTPANPLVVSVRYGPRSTIGGQALPVELTAGSGYDVTAVEPADKPKPQRSPSRFGKPERFGGPVQDGN